MPRCSLMSGFCLRAARGLERSTRNTSLNVCVRCYSSTAERSSTDQPVRVRFAPSPTGYLHLGGLRTAMYNYLFKESHRGKFILRIEDTDQSRIVPDAVENVEDALDWMEMKPDESPRYGGPFAPYVQSQRLHLYTQHAEQLLETGAAYRCFCSSVRLELLRKNCVKAGEVSRYDNKCRSLPVADAKARHAAGEKSVIRLRFDASKYSFDDMVFGPVSCAVDREADFVLIKSDGYPTYHFANVVDDHLMQISHVLRGVEWQISTPKHLGVYGAFGWKPPQFAHLPLLMTEDGTKLSKRKGALDVLEYKKQGIYPEALVSFMSQAGGGFRTDLAKSNVLRTVADLAERFDLSKMNRNSCQLNFLKLPIFNKQALALRRQNPANRDSFALQVGEIVKEKFGVQPSDEQIRKAVNWMSEQRLTTVFDLVSRDSAFIWRRPELSEKIRLEVCPVVSRSEAFFKKMPANDWEREHIGKVMREMFEKENIKYKTGTKVLRLALSGLDDGPAVAEIMEVLGREECLLRLQMAFRELNFEVEDVNKAQAC